MSAAKLNVALVGTRGVPANYGGFETCAEELAVGLVKRGHAVSVYCRYGNAPGDPPEYQGVRLVYRPSIETKTLGTFSHTAASLVHAALEKYDVVMVFNAANGPLCVLPRLLGMPVAINVDGLEWRRQKWGWAAKQYYQLAEWISTRLARRVVSDSREIQRYYEARYRTPSTFLAYGAHVETSAQPSVLSQYGLESGRYFLVASRLEPENNANYTVDAFAKVATDMQLVIAGGANWDSPFVRTLKSTKDPRVRFLGPVYTPGHIRELHCHSYAYVHGNEVGGTNPALLKAMGYGNCVLALNVPFNAEVLDGSGVLYEKNVEDLAGKMQNIVDHSDQAACYRHRSVERVRQAYTWDRVVAGYETLFQNLAAKRYRRGSPSDDLMDSGPRESLAADR